MAYKKESAIYSITCLVNGKKYVGQTTGVRQRLYHHRYYLNRNEAHHPILQEDWNKYGESAFRFDVLEYTDNLDDRERYWIAELNAFENGYNTTTGGIFENRQDARQRAIRGRSLIGANNPMYGIAKGETNPNAKLTEAQVIEIKKMIKSGASDGVIKAHFSLSHNQYHKIKHGRTWTHIVV